ncbi:MFS transporter [Gordonia sp. HY002]|uniref:MFS transporter n=1 Tax=Gordonia zhenghanii TaxID=2911516 RepID=UPI001EF08184|nr:MFS transporter [Gordonia zhenghanii]MCF8571944.1 MFS transporter [Gordonia zhenghanii]MCF8604162.1 MFS transporter [Gordonia zhenghanii]
MKLWTQVKTPDLLRYLGVKVLSQISDGAFQAALAFSILFNPDRHTDPIAVAAGFAVLLLPYSLLGPFAGALLDHWDRRRVLVWINAFRAVAIVLVAIAMSSGVPDTVVLLAALLATGCSRFVASGLSAGLPHVASSDVIIEVNAVFTTLGAGMLAVGAGLSTLLRAIFGSDNGGSGATLLAGAVFAIASGLLAAAFAPKRLGPDRPDGSGHSALYSVGRGLAHGVRAVIDHPSVGVVLGAIGVHRLVFGMNTLMLLIVVRNVDLGAPLGTDVQAMAEIGVAVAAGALLAAVVTPWSVHHFGRRRTIAVALVGGALAEALVGTLTSYTVLVGAAVLGLVGQIVKLCGDVAMQCDVPDSYRGQVFAVQDALFNTAFVVAMFIAAVSIPADGFSVPLIVAGTVVYLLGALLVWRASPAVVEGPDRATVLREEAEV